MVKKILCHILGHRFTSATVENTSIGTKTYRHCSRCGYEDVVCYINQDKMGYHGNVTPEHEEMNRAWFKYNGIPGPFYPPK